MQQRRVVVVAPMLPHPGIPHAGGRYLHHLVTRLEASFDLTVLVPNTPTNRSTTGMDGAPRVSQIVGSERARTLHGRALARVLSIADRQLRRLDPGLPSLPFAAALLLAGPARRAIEEAEVIDLQWSESIRLAGLVRRLNPDARLLGTFHDVQSQLFSREPSTRVMDAAYWRFVAWRSRRHERRGLRALDETWVFSEKDSALLGGGSSIRVVPPALADGTERPREAAPAPPRTVLFVANLTRDENDKGALWLIYELWPGVVDRCPDAVLRIVGIGASTALTAAAARRPEVSLLGFIDDLEPEYASAWVVVVPLRQGAGVKFKTIEALLHDVPTVTTTVGAEGIDGPDLFTACSDEPLALVDALVRVLDAPEGERSRSAQALHWAQQTYGPAAFLAAIEDAYWFC